MLTENDYNYNVVNYNGKEHIKNIYIPNSRWDETWPSY